MPNQKERARAKRVTLRGNGPSLSAQEIMAATRRAKVIELVMRGRKAHQIGEEMGLHTDRVADYLVSAVRRGELVVPVVREPGHGKRGGVL